MSESKEMILEGTDNTMVTVEYYLEAYEPQTREDPGCDGGAIIEDILINGDSIIESLKEEVVEVMELTLNENLGDDEHQAKCEAIWEDRHDR